LRCRGRDPADRSAGVCACRSRAVVAKADYEDAVNRGGGIAVVVGLLDSFLGVDSDAASDDEHADAVDAGRHDGYVSTLGTAHRRHDRDVAAARGHDDNTLRT
jgi:hypothetical protein